MGCSSSIASSDPRVRRDLQLKAVAKTLDKLGATRAESEVIYQVFDKVDLSKDGFLQSAEFEMLLKLPSTPQSAGATAFRKRLFKVFDRTNALGQSDTEVSFAEFVTGCFKYCTYTKYSLISLAFVLLDQDGSGQVDAEEIADIMRDLALDPTFDASLLEGIDLASMGQKGAKIPLTEVKFAQFALKHPAVLYPACRVQGELRERVMGAAFWAQLTAKRSGETYVQDLKSWVLKLKQGVSREGALATALTKARDGFVGRDDVVGVAEADAVKKDFDKWFNNGLIRSMSSGSVGSGSSSYGPSSPSAKVAPAAAPPRNGAAEAAQLASLVQAQGSAKNLAKIASKSSMNGSRRDIGASQRSLNTVSSASARSMSPR